MLFSPRPNFTDTDCPSKANTAVALTDSAVLLSHASLSPFSLSCDLAPPLTKKFLGSGPSNVAAPATSGPPVPFDPGEAPTALTRRQLTWTTLRVATPPARRRPHRYPPLAFFFFLALTPSSPPSTVVGITSTFPPATSTFAPFLGIERQAVCSMGRVTQNGQQPGTRPRAQGCG